MTAALLLESRGLRVVVLEAQSVPVAEPKAISLDDESLRVYQSARMTERILAVIAPGTGTKYFGADAQPLFHARGPEPYRLGYPFKNPFAQPELERVLRKALQERRRVDLRFGARVTGLASDGAGAELQVTQDGRVKRIRGRFVIGADGGRSTVRTQLGIGMVGRSYPDPWLVVDTLEDDHDERYGLHYGTPDRPHVIIPGLEGRCRYEFLLSSGEGEPGTPPTLELMRRLVSPYRTLTADQVQRAVIYRFHALNAQRWRSGSVFLMGDAAHMMPPFAGQGLNSGVRDAANLCWKLADVLHGHLSVDTLDTYEAERRPHAEATIRLSERLGRVVMTPSLRVAQARDRLIGNALKTPEGRAFWEGMRYRPEARLSEGLVVPADRPDLVGAAVTQPRGYHTLARAVVRFDTAAGNGWSLVGADVPASAWGEVDPVLRMTAARPVVVAADDRLPRPPASIAALIDVDGALDREFAPFNGRFVLLRPDRVVAATWRPGETAAVTGAIRKWFDVNDSPTPLPTSRPISDAAATAVPTTHS
jgi:3-(3-hydroxy-phenyl)propionate hydroxylase